MPKVWFYLYSILNSPNWITWACEESLAINQSKSILIDKDGHSSLKGQRTFKYVEKQLNQEQKHCNSKYFRKALWKSYPFLKVNKWREKIMTLKWSEFNEDDLISSKLHGREWMKTVISQTDTEWGPDWGSMVRKFLNQPQCLPGHLCVFVFSCDLFNVPSAFLSFCFSMSSLWCGLWLLDSIFLLLNVYPLSLKRARILNTKLIKWSRKDHFLT